MATVRKSFKSIADFQRFVQRFFPSYKGQMLTLGQSPCAVTVQSAFHRGYNVHINTATDAMCAVGDGTFPGMTNFQMFSAPVFCHGVLINPGELVLGTNISYATVAHSAHKAYSFGIRTDLLADSVKDVLATGSNAVKLSTANADQLIKCLNYISDGNKIDKYVFASGINKLVTSDLKRDTNQHCDWNLTADLIRIAHSQVEEERLKLPDLSKLLLSNKDKITQISNDVMGITPMTLLRNARLHQCRHLIQKQKKSITEARVAYGFSNRKDFNERYERLFGESPTETTEYIGSYII